MRKLMFFVLTCFIVAAIAGPVCAESGKRGGWLHKLLKGKRASGQEEQQPKEILSEKDIPYTNTGALLQKLDIYYPEKSDATYPVLIHFHGGGWKIGDKQYFEKFGGFYPRQGIIFVTANYRLSPDVHHPAHAQDCAAAVAWVFAHIADYGGDVNRVYLCGHSAGAHLAALLATQSGYLEEQGIPLTRLAGVIPVDTASFDLTSSKNERMIQRFVYDAFGADQVVLKEASPLLNLSADKAYPSFLILVSQGRPEAVEQSRAFANALLDAGAAAKIEVIEDHTHRQMSLGMFDQEDPVSAQILKFILEERS